MVSTQNPALNNTQHQLVQLEISWTVDCNVLLVPVVLSLRLQGNGDPGSPRWPEARLRRQISNSDFSSNFS